MTELNCPNCGAGLGVQFAAVKMTTCASCDTTVILDGDHMQNVGHAGAMHETPQIFQIGTSVMIAGTDCNILGHARFDYGPGWWDEYFVRTVSGRDGWVSVDEGDVILQFPVAENDAPAFRSAPELGTIFEYDRESFRVTERDDATCVAVRGAFPEVLQVGARYSFVNCLGVYGTLLSGEFSTGAPDWYTGQWVDPFEFEGVASA